ncbi:MAG TPA: hypothetical protein VGB94_09630 [Acidobacteriaceae bacterium]
MSSKQSLQLLSRFRAAAIALSLAAGIAAIPAVAQQAQTTAAPAASSYLASPNLQLFSSSSATSSQNEAVAGESASLSASHIGPNADANAQGGYGGAPPRRRPYGRPTYRDRYTNADGSSKLAWEAGAGFTVPTQESGQYLKPSYKFTFGAGRAFSKNFAILAEYNYDHFGIPDAQLNSQLSLYNTLGAQLTQLNGNAHTWSLTLEPVLSFYSSGKAGAYVIGGGGFYRKITNFTTPTIGTYCDYECYPVAQDQTIDHYSNNAGGLNIGAGLTYKVSNYSNLKLFAEARYVWVDNSPSSTNTAGAPNYGYPAANFETKYIPVTFGVRF